MIVIHVLKNYWDISTASNSHIQIFIKRSLLLVLLNSNRSLEKHDLPFLSFTAFTDDDAQRNFHGGWNFIDPKERKRGGTSSWMEWYCSSITSSACSSIHIQRSIWRYFCLQRARFTITPGYTQISFPARDYRCLSSDGFRASETVDFNSRSVFVSRKIKRRMKLYFVSFENIYPSTY